MILEALMPLMFAATPSPTDDYWYSGYPVRDGEADVSPNGALQVTAVMACIRVLAETMAQLPLHLMAEAMASSGRKRRRAIDQPLYDVLHDQPNDWQTSFEFREMMQGHLTLRGNAYAQIKPGPRGAVDQLIPLHPGRMRVFRLETGRIGYLYRDRKGEEYRLTQNEVFHLRGMSLDDCVGLSVISACRNAVELAQQLDKHGIQFYRNSARPSGIIKMPEGFYFDDEDHAKRVGKSWRDAHSGKDLFTVAFLEGGAEWQQLGLSNEDAQWLESKRKSVTEIAMMFRVPPHMIGSAIEHGHTYANVEQSDIAFMKHAALPWARRWEGAIKRDLIVQPKDSPERFYAKFGMDGLLRADSKTRASFYAIMLRNRVYTRNEVRDLEDKDPVEGGDEFDEVSQPVVPGLKGQAMPSGKGEEEDRREAARERQMSESAGEADVKTTVQKEGGEALAAASVSGAAMRTAMEELNESTRNQAETLSSLVAGVQQHRDNLAQTVQAGNAELTQHLTDIAVAAQPAGQDIARDAWITDTAERIAGAEIALLEKRADKATEDRRKFDAWAVRHWGGKGQAYLSRAVTSILSAYSVEDVQTVTAELCSMAVRQLTTDDPVEVLQRWQGGGRAKELKRHLMEAVNNGR